MSAPYDRARAFLRYSIEEIELILGFQEQIILISKCLVTWVMSQREHDLCPGNLDYCILIRNTGLVLGL